MLESLLPLHRTTAHLHQVLQEARKVIPDDRDLINFRDLAYELERQSSTALHECQECSGI